MSVSDELMYRYYLLLTDLSLSEIVELKKAHPRKSKEDLAKRIISDFHGPQAAEDAAAEFRKVFSEKQLPDEMEEISIPAGSQDVLALLRNTQMVASNSEARRLIRQGAVSFIKGTGNSQKLSDETAQIMLEPDGEYILKVGARKFKKIKVK